jgi:hypothetical protein
VSISALTSQAGRLLDAFEQKESAIDSAVAAAIAAIPDKTQINLYVDSIAGTAEGAGTEASPVASVAQAFLLLGTPIAQAITIRLACDGDYTLAAMTAPMSVLAIRGNWNPRALGVLPVPPLRMAYTVASGVVSNAGVYGDRVTVALYDLHLYGPAVAPADVALPRNDFAGVSRSGLWQQQLYQRCRITLDNMDVNDGRAVATHLYDVDIFRAEGSAAKLIRNIGGTYPTQLAMSFVTYPAAETLFDVLGFNAFDAAGAPIGVLSNIAINNT